MPGNEKDWKEQLPDEDEERLNELLKTVSKYRQAYSEASDIKVAQLWCAILEMNKANAELQERIARIEELLENMLSLAKIKYEEKKKLGESLETY
ncbi:MAG: hypothetical protein HYY37_02140 [Candidatus Aenigmarchaeota archaeon]|nr:hypothetical protein [Candidatus Aenigmarchaeota archaeon]